MASTASFARGKERTTLHFEPASLRVSQDALGVNWRDGRAPMVIGRAALASQRLIEAIETSSPTGRPADIEG